MWTGQCRNVAVEHADGEYIMLMDDDNIAKNYEIEVFMKAMRATRADIITCQQQPFASLGPGPVHDAELPIGFMAIGANTSQVLF